MENAGAIVWHKRCGTRITQTSAYMGCGRNSVNRITKSQAKGDTLGAMLALRWIAVNVTKYRESKTPTAESKYAIDYSRRLELFETACKVFAIPMEVRHL